MALILAEEFRTVIIEHCVSAAPNEGCGLFAMDADVVKMVYPTSNADASPSGFTVPPEEHFAALSDAESRGWRLGGVFHSHPNGEARPSMVDVTTSLDPEWTYVVVGLRGAPELRAWTIRGTQVTELEIS